MKNLFLILMLVFSCVLSHATTDLNADQALKKLKEGNARFAKGQSKHPHQNQATRDLTSTKGQHPFVTVIACSDSRVPVEELFDAGIGDIFTIRVAGNVVAVDEAGSIEYGVDHLGTPLFVVLGHSGCGAVTAVCQHAELHGNIPELVDNIIPAVEKAQSTHGELFSDDLLSSAIQNNVWQSIEDLLHSSHVSAELVKSGKLRIVGAVYNLATGKVEWMGQHPNQNTLLQSSHTASNHTITQTSLTKDSHSTVEKQFVHARQVKSDKSGKINYTYLVILVLVIAGIYFLIINNQTSLKLKLRGRILAVALSITSLLTFVAIINSLSLRKTGEEIKSINEEDIVLMAEMTDIEANALEQEIVVQKVLFLAREGVYKNKAQIQSLEKKFDDLTEISDNTLDQAITLCTNVLNTKDDQAVLDEFSYLLSSVKQLYLEQDKFADDVAQAFQMVNSNRAREVGVMADVMEAEAMDISHRAADILENLEAYIAENSKKVILNQTKAINTNLIVSIAAILIAIALGFSIAASISNQLGGEPEEVAEISNYMAEGNLSFDINRYGHRTGAMKNMLNMTNKVREVISTIITGAGNISAAGQQLSSASQQISSGVNEQAAASEEVSSSMEEMAANIQQNTANASQTRNISAKATESMEQVAVASEDSMNAVKDIYSKINIVVEIAEKTDLLAINAAVEAARAGDQGRGFAVVAAEVRKLAERSQTAANEIVGLAERGLKLTEESASMLNDIVPNIIQTSQLVEEIATASQEQDAGADQINSAIQQLSMVTQQNASASEEMAGSSEEMASQAAELEEVTSFFTLARSNGFSKVTKKNVTIDTNMAPTNGNGKHTGFQEQPIIDILKNNSKDENYISM